MASNTRSQSVDEACVKCTRLILTKRESFKCFMCDKRTHRECAEVEFDERNSAKLNRTTSDHVFLCCVCKPLMKNPAYRVKISNTEAAMNAMKQAHEAEMAAMKANFTALETEYNAKSVAIQDLERRLDQMDKDRNEASGSNGPKKRPRVEDVYEFTGLDGMPEFLSVFLEKQQALNDKNLNAFMTIIEKLEAKQTTTAAAIEGINMKMNNMESIPLAANTPPTVISRPRTVNNAPTSAVLKTKGSYAAALAKSITPPEAIRNITIVGTETECDKVAALLRKDNLVANLGVTSIKNKGQYNFTVKCVTPADALKVEDELKKKYRESIEIKPVVASKPQIKITRIYINNLTNEELILQLREQNHWLAKAVFNIDRRYEVTTVKGTHINIIVNTDLISQRLFLDRGVVIINFNESRVYEYVNVLQCNRCLRYGHYARECNLLPRCKKCTDQHETQDCKATEDIIKCVNCLTSNKNKGTTHNVRHRSTEERCPLRIERIEALKRVFQSKN